MEPQDSGSALPQITVDKKTLKRAITASAMGNATEWFDYGVYAYAAVYIQQVFFPSDNESTSALRRSDTGRSPGRPPAEPMAGCRWIGRG